MKRVLTSVLSFFAVLTLSAQSNVIDNLTISRKYYGENKSIEVICPTLGNFLKLVNLSRSEFESAMKNHGYYLQDNPTKFVPYWNWNWDIDETKACNTFCYNLVKEEITCFVPQEYIYPTDCIASLYEELRGKLLESKDGWDLFAFKNNGWIYQVIIGFSDSQWIIYFEKVQPVGPNN